MMAAGRPGHRQRRQRRARRARSLPRCGASRTPADDLTSTSIVVGAGPAGAGAPPSRWPGPGCDVVLLERGPFPGSQEHVRRRRLPPHPRRAASRTGGRRRPIQRWVTRRATMLMTPTQALTVDFRTEAWGRPPYNGATAYRPDFDAWLAGKAEAAGASSCARPPPPGCSATATARSSACAPTGPTATSTARVVIACDGVNSLPRQGGRALPPRRRRPLHARGEGDARPAQGGDRRALRACGAATASTSRSSAAPAASPAAASSTPTSTRVAVGVVLKLPGLAAQQRAARGDHRRPQGPPGDRPARRGRRAEGVLAPTSSPRAAGTMMPDAGRRRAARGRRRRRPLPGRRHLAGGRQLRHRVGHGRRPRSRPRRCRRGDVAGAGPGAATGTGSSATLRAEGPPQAAAGARTWCCPTGCSSATRSWPATSSSACSGSTTPAPKPGLRRILRGESGSGPGVRVRDLARDAWTAGGASDERCRRVAVTPTSWPAISLRGPDGARSSFRVHERATSPSTATPAAAARREACVVACPANLFVPTADGGILFNYEQCFECGTCYLACNTEGAITWTLPRRRPRRRLPPDVKPRGRAPA